MSLVGLNLRNQRWVFLVPTSWETTAWAVNLLGNILSLDAGGKEWVVLVAIGSVEADCDLFDLVATVLFAHWTGTNTGTSN